MSQIWMDGFDHYGVTSRMLEGPWAQIDGAVISTVQARTGDHSFRFDDGSEARRVLGSEIADVIVSFGLFFQELPPNPQAAAPMQFRSGANADIVSLVVRPDGVIEARDGSETGTILGQTAGPVIVAGTWHHVECEVLRDAAVGTIEVRVDEVVVLNLSGLALGVVNIAQLGMTYISIGGGVFVYYIDDLIVRDTTGSFNNDFQGDLQIATLQPLQNSANQGWAARSIQKLDIGVLNLQDANRGMAVAYNDNVVFDIAAQDFTIETFVRFDNLLSGSENETLISKYQGTGDQRSWRLWHDGPDNSNNLNFSVSSIGTLASVTNIHTFPFAPVTDRWFHIAVSREGTTSRMFIDGIQVGVDQTDNVDYFTSTAQVFINALQGASSNVALDDTGVDGWMDGTRITVGSARYTANFDVPTAALIDDTDTELLLNYDDVGNTDGSTNAFVGFLDNGAAIQFPNDSEAFQTIDGLSPDDDNFVEAALVAAIGTLTLTAVPLNTETVTLGSKTYTFQTVLVDAANNVLIGADEEASLDNLKAAVNGEAGAGTLYGTATVINTDASLTDLPGDQVLATAITPGAAGNSLATTETVTGGSWSAATLLGGLDIPTNSEFLLSALPSEVTGIRALAMVGRNFKTTAGSSSMQMSFITVGNDVADGADRAVTLSPTYYEDTIEQDPTTSGALTPSTINGSRIRLNRTV